MMLDAMTKECFSLSVAMLVCIAQGKPLSKELRDAQFRGAESLLTFRVTDEDGNAVSNANVDVWLDMFRDLRLVQGKTDAAGVLTLNEVTCGKAEVKVRKEGYYCSTANINYRSDDRFAIRDGKWQPWPYECLIVLRKVINPTSMVVYGQREYRKTSVKGEWIGFDLEQNDFVCPGAKGKKTDFEVFFDWDGKWKDYKGMSVRIRFPDGLSGVYEENRKDFSDFKWAYHADASKSLKNEFEFSERICEDGKREQVLFDVNKVWVVKSRCLMGLNRQVVKANYAVVYGMKFACDKKGRCSLCVMSAYNPTVNDTNLEDATIAWRSSQMWGTPSGVAQTEPFWMSSGFASLLSVGKAWVRE